MRCRMTGVPEPFATIATSHEEPEARPLPQFEFRTEPYDEWDPGAWPWRPTPWHRRDTRTGRHRSYEPPDPWPAGEAPAIRPARPPRYLPEPPTAADIRQPAPPFTALRPAARPAGDIRPATRPAADAQPVAQPSLDIFDVTPKLREDAWHCFLEITEPFAKSHERQPESGRWSRLVGFLRLMFTLVVCCRRAAKPRNGLMAGFAAFCNSKFSLGGWNKTNAGSTATAPEPSATPHRPPPADLPDPNRVIPDFKRPTHRASDRSPGQGPGHFDMRGRPPRTTVKAHRGDALSGCGRRSKAPSRYQTRSVGCARTVSAPSRSRVPESGALPTGDRLGRAKARQRANALGPGHSKRASRRSRPRPAPLRAPWTCWRPCTRYPDSRSNPRRVQAVPSLRPRDGPARSSVDAPAAYEDQRSAMSCGDAYTPTRHHRAARENPR